MSRFTLNLYKSYGLLEKLNSTTSFKANEYGPILDELRQIFKNDESGVNRFEIIDNKFGNHENEELALNPIRLD